MDFWYYFAIITYLSINLPISFAFIAIFFDNKSSGLIKLYMVGALYFQYRLGLWALSDYL